MRNDEARRDREIAVGGEVTERKLGSSLFVRRPASRCEVTEENLGLPLFVHRPASRCKRGYGEKPGFLPVRVPASPERSEAA